MATKIGYGLGFLVGLALIVVIYSFSGIIKNGVETYGPDVLHVDVALADVNVSPFSGSASLTGFALGQPAGFGEGPMMALDGVSMTLRPMSLRGDHVIIDEIIIDAPLLDARLQDGQSNFEAFSKALMPGEAAPTEDSNLTLTIHRLAVTGAEMRVQSDGVLAVDEAIKLADFELTNLGTDDEGLSPGEIARHVMDFLSPQVAKALIESGVRDKVEGLADQGVQKLGAELKDKAGDQVGGLVEGAVGSLLSKKEKDAPEDPAGDPDDNN